MTVIDEQLTSIAQGIWSTVLGLPLSSIPASPLGPPHEIILTGSVAIDGAWQGTVVVQCSTALARRAASVMFEIDLESLCRDDVRDAMGELANMVGGNVKSLLPAPSRLALPIVGEGDGSLVPNAAEVDSQVWLDSGDGAVVVSLVVARTIAG
jgi:chemotaxis protein CheX